MSILLLNLSTDMQADSSASLSVNSAPWSRISSLHFPLRFPIVQCASGALIAQPDMRCYLSLQQPSQAISRANDVQPPGSPKFLAQPHLRLLMSRCRSASALERCAQKLVDDSPVMAVFFAAFLAVFFVIVFAILLIMIRTALKACCGRRVSAATKQD